MCVKEVSEASGCNPGSRQKSLKMVTKWHDLVNRKIFKVVPFLTILRNLLTVARVSATARVPANPSTEAKHMRKRRHLTCVWLL